MDRLDFTKSINSDNFENMIINFFDQTMALYNLIGSRDDINISSKTDNKSIEFILLIDNTEMASSIYESIADHDIEIYGKIYTPQLRNIKNNVHIALIDKDTV